MAHTLPMRSPIEFGLTVTFGTAVLASCLSCSAPPEPADNQQRLSTPRLELVAERNTLTRSWFEYRISSAGRVTTVYIAHDRQPKPVVFLLQGSACYPLFTVEADDSYRPTIVFQDALAPALNRVHLAMIEHPGVERVRFSSGMTQAQKEELFERTGRDCSTEYLKNRVKRVRVEDVVGALEAVASEPWAVGFVLAGHSEGTHVATGVLRFDGTVEIETAGLFASTGPTPFWGSYARRGGDDRTAFQEAFDRIRMLQRADDDFMYQGHPARRWRTYWLDSTPLDDVRESNVPLFVAHGTRDGTILAPDLFVMEAIRQQPDRPLRYVVVDDGDHAFETSDGVWQVDALFDDFLDWTLDSDRATSVTVLK